MSNLKDIKDRSPSKATINVLETLLNQAKSGELRSIIYAISFDNQGTDNGWSVDDRCYKKLILGELELLKQDFSSSMLVQTDSALKGYIDGC